jgi:NTP pyrophosphatase (non-canonical NTP hydrolase)
MSIRKELRAFAELMEERLQAKDMDRGTKGWAQRHPLWLLARAEQELKELKDSLVQGADASCVVQEAADVANFVMFIADVVAGGPASLLDEVEE